MSATSPRASVEAPAASEPPELPRSFAGEAAMGREELLGAPLRWPQPRFLAPPLVKLRGAGPRLAEAAAELELRTIGDVLEHLPHAHRDMSVLSRLAELKADEEATVLVEVRKARLRPTRRRRLKIVEAEVADDSGPARAIWYGRAWLAERLQPGTRLLLRGKPGKEGFLVSAQELLDPGSEAPTAEPSAARSPGRPGERPPPGTHTTGMVPVHPASAAIRPQRLREWAWQACGLARHAVEALPAALRTDRRLPLRADALVAAHFPRSAGEAVDARRRLAFDELFLYAASLATRRRVRRRPGAAAPLPSPQGLTREWIASLPFELTGDQRRAIEEIEADLRSDRPMQRLLMGEVGSGKTVVSVYAMVRAVEAGRQAALMAPTETLAEQHHATLIRLLAESPVPVSLLTGAASERERGATLEALAGGAPRAVVGTHALIESDVRFANLSVAVVDEQHRFGVRQRAALDGKAPSGLAPHALHMTATPIPRTLSLTLYGDLDVTALRELPAGRRAIRTSVSGGEERAEAYEYLRGRLREGRQAYVVCPLVSESEALQARAATEEAKRLAAGELRDFNLDVLHGQMPSPQKAAAMSRFATGDTDVLVATSVIEVGIDVANAAVMLVEGAERYGLSQLHQLRGRVGRGPHESACLLIGEPRSEAASARLEAIAEESDGFELAEIDLGIRGEGEVLGTRQHGLPRFRAAQLPEDISLLIEAREEVGRLLRRYGSLEAPELGPLMDTARERFGDERNEHIAA